MKLKINSWCLYQQAGFILAFDWKAFLLSSWFMQFSKYKIENIWNTSHIKFTKLPKSTTKQEDLSVM